MSLKSAMFANASTYAPLIALLGVSPFRWYDTRLEQGSPLPAVTVQTISEPSMNAVTGPLPTRWARVQFSIYGGGNDSTEAVTVAEALKTWAAQLDLTGQTGLLTYPALVVGDRDGGIPRTNPMTYMRIVDLRIFYDVTKV